MNRLGWTLLLLFLLAGAGFFAMLRTGGPGEMAGTAPPPPPPALSPGTLLIPVEGIQPAQLADTWNQPRAGGARVHHAIDIVAPRGTPVVAAAPGQVEKLFESNDGGHTVYVRADGGRTMHYYAHLDSYAMDVREGGVVAAGQRIGTVGSTGNASPEAPHLHFEVHRMNPGEKWWQGASVNPYPLLMAK